MIIFNSLCLSVCRVYSVTLFHSLTICLSDFKISGLLRVQWRRIHIVLLWCRCQIIKSLFNVIEICYQVIHFCLPIYHSVVVLCLLCIDVLKFEDATYGIKGRFMLWEVSLIDNTIFVIYFVVLIFNHFVMIRHLNDLISICYSYSGRKIVQGLRCIVTILMDPGY